MLSVPCRLKMSFDINKKEGGGVTCEDMQGSNALAVPMARDGETKGTSCPATGPATAATGAQHSLHPSRTGSTSKGNCFIFSLLLIMAPEMFGGILQSSLKPSPAPRAEEFTV